MSSNNGKYPLLLYGEVQDFSNDWTAVGSLVVTGSIADLFGEANAFTLNDASAGVLRYAKRSISLGVGVTSFPIWFVVDPANSTTADGLISVYDTDAAAHIRTVKIHISGGVVTLVNVTGSVTTIDKVITVGSYYLCRVWVTGFDPLNANEIWVAPAAATVSDVTGTGTLTILMRSLAVFGRPLEDPEAWPVDAPGSQSTEISSGIRDRWKTRNKDQVFAASARLIPSAECVDANGLGDASGWDGEAESPGVNCGISALLAAGSDDDTIRFVPDRTVPGTFVDSYMIEPTTEKPETERWVRDSFGLIALRQLRFTLRSVDGTPFRGF